ncbi:MAG: L-ribulose-5-phosphate 4-epimerase AraD [Firmicutes bacterium]|nr:L-ribulose-5-phosphate 4-epimerase AraD [Bacillota bacterium]
MEALKAAVLAANLELPKRGLVSYTWGNVSGISRDKGLVAIKPSGVKYHEMRVEDIVVVNLEGRVVEGTLKPSSDTPTHIALYKAWPSVGGIAHTHSAFAAMWAQACRPIPCFGTTHADYYYGEVPCTRELEPEEILEEYEKNTGEVIAETYIGKDPLEVPGVLVAKHGPFTWGEGPMQAVDSSAVLEQIAKMALGTVLLSPSAEGVDQMLLDKHFLRKHGQEAYYGQE